MKLLEGNASNRVCLSVHREGSACAKTDQSRVTRGFFISLSKAFDADTAN